MGILLQGFLLGAVGGVIPGAVLTILLVSTLQGGLKAGFRAFFWAMLSEIIIAGGLLLLATLLPLSPIVFVWIGVVGSLILLYFSWQVFQLRSITVHKGSTLFTPSKIFLLSATNAPLYIFWTTVCFPLVWQLAVSWSLSAAALSYFVIFEIGWAATTCATLLLFAYARTVLTNEGVMRWVFTLIALLLASLALRMLLHSVTQLL
jgi:threonine/homoserine/homoserine lactone efflux protein